MDLFINIYLCEFIKSVGFLCEDVSACPQQPGLGVQQPGGDPALGPQHGRLKLDGVGDGEVRHRDLDHLTSSSLTPSSLSITRSPCPGPC